MSAAFDNFLKSIVREGKMPRGILADQFYHPENLCEIKRRIDDYESGKVQLVRTTMEELEAEIHG